MSPQIAFVLLFAIATAVTLAVRRLDVPYTVALVIAGLVLGATHLLAPLNLTKSLLYSIFLPGLVFEAAFHLDITSFLRNKWAILALAVPGVLTATALTAALVTPLTGALALGGGLSLVEGLVFGAVLSATDPIAALAIFRTLGAPRRLRLLIEGESLLNDGTAAVLVAVLLDFAAGHGSALHGVAEFARVVGEGVGVGLLVGFAASKIIQRVDDAMIEISITTVVAYASFVVAEQLDASGLLATVAAGMVCGNYGARTGMSATTRVAVETFWSYLAFALNSFVFLLLGFAVPVSDLLASWAPILIAFAAVTLGRAAVVVAVGLALRRSHERVPLKWLPILVWGGQRGALSMVLALGLPPDFPHRRLFVTMTIGVVTLSILLQGLTSKWLLKRLGLVEESEARLRFDLHRAAIKAASQAFAALERLRREHIVPPPIADELEAEWQARLHAAQAAAEAVRVEHPALHDEEKRRATREMLLAEKQSLLDARVRGAIGERAFRELLAEVDGRLLEIESYD